ncbi:hypothetical protein QP938_05270 [Porticoccaceae bacterium LTM1]|nr:hypothetical protein QP938_05270 [Porticoccaceae bacterium LTM1]
MDTQLLDEVIDCLSGERYLFRYGSDQYAVVLLQRLLQESDQKISELRKSSFGRLLNKPVIQKVVARKGDGKINRYDLDRLLADADSPYILTLDRWGNKKDYRWSQISRPGENLVLQMNFNRQHDQDFERLLEIDREEFNGWSHPTCKTGRSTLCWARLDLDFESGQALIEEIQTDWYRDVFRLYRRKEWAENQQRKQFKFWGYELSVEKVHAYCARTLEIHRQWNEAMLTAVLKFLWEELGIHDVYYHSYETGRILKNIGIYSGPPRSLYTDLPKRFCFEEVRRGPQWIENCTPARRRLKKIKQPKWFRLAI